MGVCRYRYIIYIRFIYSCVKYLCHSISSQKIEENFAHLTILTIESGPDMVLLPHIFTF